MTSPADQSVSTETTADNALMGALADGAWHHGEELIQVAMTALMARPDTLTEGQRITADTTTPSTEVPDQDRSLLAGAKAIARTALTAAARNGRLERDPDGRRYRVNPAAARTWGKTRIQ